MRDNELCIYKWRLSGSKSHGHAFVLVYSVADRYTFEDIIGYCSQIRRVKRDPAPLFVLVGNKCDLGRERQVSFEEGAALALELGCDFYETSARTGENVECAVQGVIRLSVCRETSTSSKLYCPLWNLLCCM